MPDVEASAERAAVDLEPVAYCLPANAMAAHGEDVGQGRLFGFVAALA